MILYCSFDSHLSDNWWCWSSFNVPIGYLYVFFEETSVYTFCPFFDWVVWFCDIKLNELFVYFGSQSLVSHIIWKYFLPVHRFFVSFMVSFAVPKLLSFIRSHLLIFTFMSFPLEDWSKKILLRFMSENVLPMFSCRSFMVLYFILILRTLNSFELISLFLCVVWGSVPISLIYMRLLALPTPLPKETVFSPPYILASFFEDWLTMSVRVYFWALHSVPLICMSVFVLIPRCFDYCSSVVLFEV